MRSVSCARRRVSTPRSSASSACTTTASSAAWRRTSSTSASSARGPPAARRGPRPRRPRSAWSTPTTSRRTCRRCSARWSSARSRTPRSRSSSDRDRGVRRVPHAPGDRIRALPRRSDHPHRRRERARGRGRRGGRAQREQPASRADAPRRDARRLRHGQHRYGSGAARERGGYARHRRPPARRSAGGGESGRRARGARRCRRGSGLPRDHRTAHACDPRRGLARGHRASETDGLDREYRARRDRRRGRPDRGAPREEDRRRGARRLRDRAAADRQPALVDGERHPDPAHVGRLTARAGSDARPVRGEPAPLQERGASAQSGRLRGGVLVRVARERLASRTVGFTESVIREMTRLNAVHGGINLAQGFPNFAAPAELKEAAKRAIDADVNQYAITWGAKSLRDAVARTYRELYGMAIDPETMLTVTCGSTEAMVSTLLAIVDPGDEVVVLEPFYENYGPDAAICGATPVFVPLRPPDYVFDPDELRHAFSARTKAIIVNTPNNPTGRVFTRAELELIASLCREHDAIAVTDEIYEHILYAGRHIPIATLEGMAERTVTISGASKTFSVTGRRVSWIVAPPGLTSGIRKVHDFVTVGAPAPLQEAVAVGLGLGRAYYERLARDYRARRDLLVSALAAAGFAPNTPAGAYYVLCDITPFGFEDDTEFAHWLLRRGGRARVPRPSLFSPPPR